MNKFSLQTSSTASAEEQPIITSNYQKPIIEVYNPNQLTQGADGIMHESNSGYYS